MRKGTMIPVKQVLGWIIGIAGVGILFKLPMITNLLTQYQLIYGGLLIAAGYFMVIAGRQR